MLDTRWQAKSRIGIARKGEQQQEGEVNENQSERMSKVEEKESEGERKNVSDMNPSACVTLGRVSFHLFRALVMQIEKEVLIWI